MLTEKPQGFIASLYCQEMLCWNSIPLLKLTEIVSEKGPRQQGGLILYIPPTFLTTQYTQREQENQL